MSGAASGYGPSPHPPELCVTRRCRRNDLGRPRATLLELQHEHPAVDLFATAMSRGSAGRHRRVEIRGMEFVFLSSGQQAALAWVDEDRNVAWLVAATTEDAPAASAAELVGDLSLRSLIPTQDDYRRALHDRTWHKVEPAVTTLEQLLAAADEAPGQERTAPLPGGRFATVLVPAPEGDDRTLYVAFDRSYSLLPLVLATMMSTTDVEDVCEQVTRLPTRELRPDEIAYRCSRDV